MILLTPSQLSERLNQHAESVCHELIPHGKRKGTEWTAGDLYGKTGESLKIHLAGDKTGVWADFATDQRGGDLLDLWCAARNLDLGQAMNEAACWLGIKPDARFSRPKRLYRTPDRPKDLKSLNPNGAVVAYLKSRGMQNATLNDFCIVEQPSHLRFPQLPKDSGVIVFPYLDEKRQLINCKYLAVLRPDGKKLMLQEGGCEPCLFGWQALPATARTVAITEGECFPGTAEVFTRDGWVCFSEYAGQPLVQWVPGSGKNSLPGRFEFVEPLARILKPYEGELIEYYSERFYSLTTPGHHLWTIDHNTLRLYRHTAADRPPYGRIPRSSFLDGPGILESPDRIVATLTEEGPNPPDWPREWLWRASIAQRKAIIAHWIARADGTTLWCRNVKNAEWIQAMAHLSGCCTVVTRHDRIDGRHYRISLLLNRTYCTWEPVIQQSKPYQGTVYCVTVPSGAILTRQHGIVSISGNCDAMTLHQAGIPALSVPMGGGGGAKQDWIEADYDRLQRFDIIYLALDADAAGREATEEIVRRLGNDRCRIVEWPEPYKDANECLMAGRFTPEDFQKCFARARTLDPAELKPASSYLGAVLHEFYPAPNVPRGLATPWTKVGDRLRFRPGETTVWFGFNGHGKSLVLNHLIAAGLQRGEKFCVASMEMLPARTLQRLVRQLTGIRQPTSDYITHCLNVVGDKIWVFDLLGTAKTERMLEVFAYAARRYQIGHFIVDSLSKCGLAEDDYNGQKALVERLVDFAHEYNIHVHLVNHARKGADERNPPGKMDVKGTGAITDLADNVIGVWRNKNKEELRARRDAEGEPFEAADAEKPDAALFVSKQRHGDWEGEVWLWFHADSQQYLTGFECKPTVYVDYVGQPNH